MKKIKFFFLVTLFNLTFADKKCCETCIDDTVKYYSIPFFFKNNCGESCIKPEDYKKYKLFEPSLEIANSTSPCYDRGFKTYQETKVHGFGPLKVTIDFYKKK